MTKNTIPTIALIAASLLLAACSDSLHKDARVYAQKHAQCMALSEADPNSDEATKCWNELDPLLVEMQNKYAGPEEEQKFLAAYYEEIRKCDISDDFREYLDFMDSVNRGSLGNNNLADIDLDNIEIDISQLLTEEN
ncbi:MAG: hypothetical protein K5864_05755 [Bacteroidales bacterium]|nr:hypothetical protein [Bacteroidales bacterium]